MLDTLSSRGVLIAGLDLEVGPGTFKPVETDDPREHAMHPERYEISFRLAAMVELVREQGGRVWAVGRPWSARSRARRWSTGWCGQEPGRPAS